MTNPAQTLAIVAICSWLATIAVAVLALGLIAYDMEFTRWQKINRRLETLANTLMALGVLFALAAAVVSFT